MSQLNFQGREEDLGALPKLLAEHDSLHDAYRELRSSHDYLGEEDERDKALSHLVDVNVAAFAKAIGGTEGLRGLTHLVYEALIDIGRSGELVFDQEKATEPPANVMALLGIGYDIQQVEQILTLIAVGEGKLPGPDDKPTAQVSG